MYKRSVKKKVDRKGRFRTQPVTFMEIKGSTSFKVHYYCTVYTLRVKK
jgi:hypothetical protein